jgi:hypothetical protein
MYLSDCPLFLWSVILFFTPASRSDHTAICLQYKHVYSSYFLCCMKPSSVYYAFCGNKLIFNILITTVCYWTTCARNNAAFISPSKSHVIYQCYTSSESGNLICFEGHTDNTVRPQYAREFYMVFLCTGEKNAFYGLINMVIVFVWLQYWTQNLPELELMCPIPKAVISSSKSFKLVSSSDSILIVGEAFFEVCVCHTRT